MSVIEARICTPFKQTLESVSTLQNKVLEGCQLAQFEHMAEAIEVMEAMESMVVPLVYTHLIHSITLTLGSVEVRFFLRYDAAPQDEDELDISGLELVRYPPFDCQLRFSITDWHKAEFLGAGDLEELSSEHVKIIVHKYE